MSALKIFSYKLYFSLMLLYEENTSSSFLKGIVIAICSGIVWVADRFGMWFSDNAFFVTGVVAVILINMIFGGLVHHYRYRDFNWKILLTKTSEMVIVLLVSYFVLEIILNIAGDTAVSSIFRITIQVSTVLYPGTKIIKNVYIYSRGEYPPEWLVKRIFNFNKNGNLQELLNPTNNERNTLDQEK
jgi:hypothetical protein